MPHLHRLPVRRLMLATTVALGLALAAAACSTGTPTATDGPAGVVREALAKVSAKDVEGLRSLACAGQEDRVREVLGLATGGAAALIPGLDTQKLLDAVTLDVHAVTLGDPAISGDTANVPVGGSVKVTFDKEAMRPLLRQVLAQQGSSMTDAQLDALLTSLQSYGQDVPVNQTVRLVREGDAWKICQESITVPSQAAP